MGPKPKKSKEEIEAEKAAEEAERAKQAANAAKQAAIAAEKARLEELRLAEERRVQRQAEFVRLGEELAVYQDKLRDRQAARAAEDALLVRRPLSSLSLSLRPQLVLQRTRTSHYHFLTHTLHTEISNGVGEVPQSLGPTRRFESARHEHVHLLDYGDEGRNHARDARLG
jgi:hypothetical protein